MQGRFNRWLLVAVLHVVRWPKQVLLASAALLVGCILLAVFGLNISTDQDKLFSRDVSFFHDYLSFTNAFPENQAIYVVVQAKETDHTPSVDRWTDCADAIASKLTQDKANVSTADSHIPVESLGPWAMLFDDPENLPENAANVRKFLPLARVWGEKPPVTGLVNLFAGASPLQRFLGYLNTATPDADTAQFAATLADGWTRSLKAADRPIRQRDQVPDLSSIGATDPSKLGYYYMPDEKDPSKHLLLIRVFENSNYSSMGSLADSVNAIRKDARDAAASFLEFTVGVTGRTALEADEMVTTDTDARRAEIIALITVFVGLVFLLRSLWLAVAAEIALLVGIGWTFGWATVTVHELNLLSMVFLIALIGIGMDYLIQVLSRYRQEAARHDDPRVIWVAVFRHVAPPINTACLGAAGAFFVSVFTNFQGAADLGIIASGGLLLCLLAGYVILPALLTIWPARIKPNPVRPDMLVLGHSHNWYLGLPVLWFLLLALGFVLVPHPRFDPSLLNMQPPDLESVKLVRHLQTWSAVELSPDLNLLRKVREAVAASPQVKKTESILTAYDNYDWLQKHTMEVPEINWVTPAPVQPKDIPRIARSAAGLAARFRTAGTGSTAAPVELVQSAASLESFASTLETISPELAANRLSDWQSVFIGELKGLLGQFHPPPLEPDKLPSILHDHLIGADGRYALYILPKEDLWTQANLAAFVPDLEGRIKNVPGAPAPTGIAINIFHSTSSIQKSFYKAASYALILIVILVRIDLRNWSQTLLAISVLALGLPMLVILMGKFGVSWNFANFFGLPILIGAGHEYGVFMVHRYHEVVRDPRRIWPTWDVSDKALLLCAFVTTSSFGFFWLLAHHRGLKSLGMVMCLGTACIYLSTLCVLRPMLRWHLEHRGLGQGSTTSEASEVNA